MSYSSCRSGIPISILQTEDYSYRFSGFHGVSWQGGSLLGLGTTYLLTLYVEAAGSFHNTVLACDPTQCQDPEYLHLIRTLFLNGSVRVREG